MVLSTTSLTVRDESYLLNTLVKLFDQIKGVVEVILSPFSRGYFETQSIYFSCQVGWRFSKKALTPSLASSVVQRRAKASFIRANCLW